MKNFLKKPIQTLVEYDFLWKSNVACHESSLSVSYFACVCFYIENLWDFRPWSNFFYGTTRTTSNKKKQQEQVDKILDKISKAGYDSLTKAEKDFLFQQSKKN